jgi:preprotein translocase subunit SecE
MMATGKGPSSGLLERLKRPFMSLSKFLREVMNELQRVVWPSHEETYGFTVVVIIAVVITAIWVGFWDYLFSNIVTLLGL